MGRFKKFTKLQFKSLIHHLEKFENTRALELLHKIRVDIKKIKAALLLTNDLSKGFKGHKNFIPFRTIFRRAGEIREPEVLSSLLLAYNIPGVHNQSIEKNNEPFISGFSKDVHSFVDSVTRQWRKLKPAFKKIKGKDLARYLKKTKRAIKERLYPNPEMDLIHKTRKSMKEFIYLSGSKLRSKKKLHKFLSAEVELIGQLHDRQVLLNLLRKSNGAVDEVIARKIQEECDSHAEKIRKIARRFYRA